MNAPDPDFGGLRLPPHSVEAEQSVLGGLMLENAAMDKIAGLLTEDDFYRDEHRRIFRVIVSLIERNKPADVLTVYADLDGAGDGDHVGGLAYLGQLANNTPSAANIARYAEIVRDRAQLRRLIAVGDRITEEAFRPGCDAASVIDRAESDILAVRNVQKADAFVTLTSALQNVIQTAQDLYDRGDQGITGMPSGLIDLDRKTAGFQDTDVIVIAGRPGMGKTALALQCALNTAMEKRVPVGIFSLEMPAKQLASRQLANVARVPLQAIRTGHLSDDQWSRLAEAQGKLQYADIHIDETPGLTPLELRSKARRLYRQTKGRLGMIVIDYLQLMQGNRRADNRASELSEISGAIKTLAKELKIPILALSQLNRSLENRPNKRPVISDLRESGAIEQDADIIMFVYRDEVYREDSPDKGTAELIIGKHRNGPTGTVRTHFAGEYTRFENLAPGWAPKQEKFSYGIEDD